MKEKLIWAAIAIAALLTLFKMDCKAEIAGDDAFSKIAWQQVFEEGLIKPAGVVQSICATKDYIITIENTAENQEPDVVSAYYKNKVDKDGNPVKQYSLAKRVTDTNWEHGNGMAYNPNTNEIYVALYTDLNPENRGCLFVMDPETLQYKGKIKISDDYNVLGIGYKKDTNQYVIQTNIEGGYSFKVLDSNFHVVEDLGQYANTAKGNNFQDLAVSGDYILNFPLTLNLGMGDYLHVYSISRKAMIADPKLDFHFEGITEDEPESLCEIEPGVFLAAVNVVEMSGQRKIRFYKMELPYYFHITAAEKNGQVSQGGKVLRGESFPVTYHPREGFELSSLKVNGKSKDIFKYENGYTFENVQENYKLEADFSKVNIAFFKGGPGSIFKGLPGMTMLVLGAAAFAVISFCTYLVHVKIERRRKLKSAKELRRQIAMELNQYIV